jgi:hypothetical protein
MKPRLIGVSTVTSVTLSRTIDVAQGCMSDHSLVTRAIDEVCCSV